MELSFMTQAGVDDMKTHVEEYAAMYQSADNAAMLAHLSAHGYLEKTELAALSPVELLTEGDFASTDVENVRRIYGAWRTLAPYSARERPPRFGAISSSRRGGAARSS